ncbi:fungal-specific transcription factor domain-containing protein [Ilyonectria robusta]|uniref:fungal-specific transcription factor domain-containing protein n=1 Tax=Ilyonectria robusta TaxID=1079257 RepID=UPI001E8DC21E|nr:fungal-specific transcription factor domain-containing protein [Ilyonectria robusta]KAH8656768.1 fungal-specific transcription factor domain-containing protein [Ilyonectria robusta]
MNRLNSFTGCWTCKARKIRCDEREIACENCEKKGIACGGYDVRLQWVSNPLAPPVASARGRRTIKLDKDSGNRHRIEDIDGFLADIDNDTETGVSSTRGPFSAFPANIHGCQRLDALAPSYITCFSVTDFPSGDNRSGVYASPREANRDDDEGTQSPNLWASRTISKLSLSEDSDQPREIEEGVRENSESFRALVNQSSATSQYDVGSPADSVTTYSASLASSSCEFSIRNITTRLFGDYQADLLINHYNSHIADLMQPIAHAENVFRGIYLSTALEGSVICMSNPNTSKALAYSAIYHSLLASSAFHLWNCNKTQTKYQQIGIRHRYQATCFLQGAVNASTPGTDYQVFMTAMLSLLSIGTMSGDGNDFIVHINATAQLRNLRGQWKVISHSTRKLNAISAFLAILAQTTSFQPTQSPEHTSSTSDDILVQSSNCYEHIYGITPSIAAAIQEACRLAGLLSQYNGRLQNSIPSDTLDRCEELGDRLLAWKLSSESVMSISPNDDLMLRIFTQQANAWHRAALIYYYRRIQRFSSEDLVDNVQYVAEQMHAVEDAKAQISQEPVMAPITWPGFIASCEAIGPQRDLLIKWWKRLERYNIGNITRQWEIVQELWRADDQMRQTGLGATDWTDSFRTLGFSVLAV